MIHLYVDGSFTEQRNIGGWGFTLYCVESADIIETGFGVTPAGLLKYKQIAGELLAVEFGMRKILECGLISKRIVIHHDLLTIKSLVDGRSTARSYITERYVDVMKCYEHLNIGFHKIKAHSGDLIHDKLDADLREYLSDKQT